MTPMAESLWWVMQQMCLLRENRKIILIITDGEPDSIPAAQEAFKQAQKKGFECYGLGIMCSNIATLLPHTSRVIETLPQLAQALFELLEGALRRKALRTLSDCAALGFCRGCRCASENISSGTVELPASAVCLAS